MPLAKEAHITETRDSPCGCIDATLSYANAPVFLLLVTLVFTNVKQSPTLHQDKTKVTTPCHAADYLTQLASNAMQMITTASTQEQQTTDKIAKLQLVAAATRGARSATTSLLAAAILAGTSKLLTKINQHRKTIFEAAAVAYRISAQMEAIQHLSTAGIQDSTYEPAPSAYQNSNYPKIEPQVTPTEHGACMVDKTTRHPAAKKTTSTEHGTNSITLIALKAKAVTNENANSPLTVCGCTACSGKRSSTQQCVTQQTTKVAVVGGSVFEMTPLKLNRQATDDTADYSTSTESGAVPSPATIKRELSRVAALEKVMSELSSLTINLDLKTIITSSELKEKIAKAIDGEQAKYTIQETKTKVDNLLKEATGENGDEIKNTIGKSLDELTIPKAAVGGNGDRQLKAITAP
uniref:Variant surface glycoprotein 1125.5008 n=1 Tax=Trypanosoma brucei TaxID=5691 RepID=A0A1J0RBF6_9TRYP|nr:variant surface glycoprotein 1125.5008 [Trypanosoma brucei]